MGKVERRIELFDRSVIPIRDLAEADLRERLAVQNHFPGLDAGNIDDGDDAADDGRELRETGCGEFAWRKRLVAGAEIDGLGLDLGDAAAGADRLIVQAD